MRRRKHSLTIVVFLGFAAPALADRIHLQNGGTIATDSWWIDGDTLVYDGPAGSVGIPRSIVVSIEPSDEAPTGRPPVDADAHETRPAAKPARRPEPAPLGGNPLQATQAGRVRDLLAEGSEAFARRDFETASAKFLESFQEDPSLAAGRLGYALAEIALGRDERALPVVLEGLTRSPALPDLHEVLGDLRDREENVEEAAREWREAFRLAPNDRLRGKIFKAERELQAGRDYTFSAAAHFNIRYDGKLDPALASEIAAVLETSWRDLSDQFRHAPPQAITVLLYPEQQFRDVTQAPESVGGLFDGKIRVPLGGIRSVDDRARRLLMHELTHAVVHSKTRGNCPRWLQEGLAQRSEGKTLGNVDRESLRRLLRDRDPAEWDSESFSYPAALSLTLSLESRRGFGGILDLLDRLGEGKSLDAALDAVYGESYAEICRRWAESLQAGARS